MKKLTTRLLAGGLAAVVPGQLMAEDTFTTDLSTGSLDLSGFSAFPDNSDQVEPPVRFFRGLLTTWHTEAQAEMAFIRPGMEWPDLSDKLVVVTETTEAEKQLDRSEWTKVIEMGMSVPVFGQNIPEGLTRSDLKQMDTSAYCPELAV